MRSPKDAPRKGKLLAIAILLAACLIGSRRTSAVTGQAQDGARPLPPVPTETFSPSNARTEDGKLIPVEQFFPASRCAACHQDTHRAWSESLHRNAAREPFYRESADILLRTRGIEFTRHCESCHTPVALFSGQLVSTPTGGERVAPFTPLDHEGVTCSVCHSITEARLDGTGSFTIRPPTRITPSFRATESNICSAPSPATMAGLPTHSKLRWATGSAPETTPAPG